MNDPNEMALELINEIGKALLDLEKHTQYRADGNAIVPTHLLKELHNLVFPADPKKNDQ